MNILLIDDDTELTDLMRRFLTNEGFTVDAAADGNAGLERIRNTAFDLAVIDVMMPGKNGMDVLRELRGFSQLPVIMLAARIRAVLRRYEASRTAAQKSEDTLQVQNIANFEWHPQSRRILENKVEIELTSSEYNILGVLLAHAGTVVEKNELTEQALGKRHGPFDRTLDVHIGRIRKKLAPLENGEPRIKTVRGIGWLLALD